MRSAFEQRAQKTANGATTDFIYDRTGHLIAEANHATDTVLREYVWMDNLPVAMVDDTGSSPVVYYIHADQLGTPQKLTDASADVVWDGVFDPFGNAISITGSLAMLLRFPGQYADAETALNQNWFRDYDPTIGRYIESDPVGLVGGINTYAYAKSSPLNWSDPAGTQAVLPITPVAPPASANPGYKTLNDYANDGRAMLNLLNQLGKLCFGEVDCGEQLKRCRQMCLDIYIETPDKLPGQGPDYQGRMRQCVRECMEANGCRNY